MRPASDLRRRTHTRRPQRAAGHLRRPGVPRAASQVYTSSLYIKFTHHVYTSRVYIKFIHQLCTSRLYIKFIHQEYTSRLHVKIIHQDYTSRLHVKIIHQVYSSSLYIKFIRQVHCSLDTVGYRTWCLLNFANIESHQFEFLISQLVDNIRTKII